MNNKLILHLLAMVSAVASSVLLLYFGFSFIEKKYTKRHSLQPIKASIKKANKLQNDLKIGKIVILGSSELQFTKQKFTPINFFNKDLNLPLQVNGATGHQSFAILSQLAALDNEFVRENAKIVIILAPLWFQGNYSSKGTNIVKYLLYMDQGMMWKLYLNNNISEAIKYKVGQYIKTNFKKINNPSFIYTYAKYYTEQTKFSFIKDHIYNEILRKIDDSNLSMHQVKYTPPILNYQQLKIKAKKVEVPMTNNPFGIWNVRWDKIKDRNYKKISKPPLLERNQEYKDFLDLIDFCKCYKNKPLFIMTDYNPLLYTEERDNMDYILDPIKAIMTKNNFGYMNMWTYNKESYEIGYLSDHMHIGELGWLTIDQKIIEYFISKDKDD